MKKLLLPCALALAAIAVSPAYADQNDDIIKEVMKSCHKAPKGTDPICKKASDGKASKEEIDKLVAGYLKLAKTTAPKGDADDWKERTTKLYDAAKKLQADPTATAEYKHAVDCKACHSQHKPE